MARQIWDGTGSAEGLVYFVNNAGVVCGRRQVRREASRQLNRSYFLSRDEVSAILAKTVENDTWISAYDGATPAAVARGVAFAYGTDPRLAEKISENNA